MGFEGNSSEINLRQHANKTWTACRQDTEYLVMFHGREESVKGTNVARDKPMCTDSSTQAQTRRVARWRSSSFCRTAHARGLRAF